MTTRTFTEGDGTALQADNVRPYLLFEAQLENEVIRLHRGQGTFIARGQEWRGMGNFLKVGNVTEGINGASQSVTISLSGLDPELMPKLEFGNYQGNRAYIYIAMINAETGALENILCIFAGTMRGDAVKDSANSVDISITVESANADLFRKRVFRTTAADQALMHPEAVDASGKNDGFFDYVHLIQSQELEWKID